MPLRQKPGTPSLLRELNDRAALELLLAEGPLTRAQLSERTGVSKVTVSQMLARLEERALVMIAGEQAGGRGPNAALYSVIPSSAYVAGLYVDFDLVSVAVADVAGNQVAEVSMDPHGADDPVGLVREAIGQACANAGISSETLSSVVIGSPGVLDPRTGAPRLAVNLPTWQEGVLDGLREVLHTPVLIENDVNLAAMAERAGGAAAGLDDFAFVWLGTGLGLASVIGGKVRRGVGGAAGEIGWMPVHGAPLPVGNEHPGKAGLQALAGGLAVQALAAQHGFSGASPADAVAAATADAASGVQGSAGAAFLDDLAQRVSIGVAAICVVLDPGLVVLGGPVGKAGGSELATRVAAEVARICLAHPAVEPTTAADEPVLRGALQTALAQARAGLLGSLGSPSEIPALESAEDQLDGSVDFTGLRCVQAAREVSEAGGVDGSHLVDQHEGADAVHLDLGAEDRGLCAGGRRGDDEGGEQDRVALDGDRVPGAALLVVCRVLGRAQPVQITTH